MSTAVSLASKRGPAWRFARIRGQALAWGWPGLAGTLSLVLAAGLALGWTPHERRQAVQLAQAAKAADGRLTALSATRQASAIERPPSARFLTGFGPLADRQERLGALLALATAHRLEPQRSEFQQIREGLPGLVRLRIAMPIVGPYAAVRDFIDEAQEHDPSLSLDSLRLRRATPGSTTVTAETHWSLYLRDDADRAGGTRSAASAAR